LKIVPLEIEAAVVAAPQVSVTFEPVTFEVEEIVTLDPKAICWAAATGVPTATASS
jgi:hypothetical protein